MSDVNRMPVRVRACEVSLQKAGGPVLSSSLRRKESVGGGTATRVGRGADIVSPVVMWP